jgi:hypothetical protein
MQAHLYKGYATELAVAALLTASAYPVAMPVGPTAWDVVVRTPSGHWATVQVKTALTDTRGAKYVDCRKGTMSRGNYDMVDFLIAYDLESHDFWVFSSPGLQGSITLNQNLLAYRNLELLNDSTCALQGRCAARGPGPDRVGSPD